jgi:hypothetical protein
MVMVMTPIIRNGDGIIIATCVMVMLIVTPGIDSDVDSDIKY